MGWIVFGVVILIAIISAVSQMLKNQQDAAVPQRRPRPRPRAAANRQAAPDEASNDIDRFLKEIERLRNRPADPPPPPPAPVAKPRTKVAKPVRASAPVVAPAKSRRLDDASRDPLPVAAPVPVRPLPSTSSPSSPASSAGTIAALGKVGSTTTRRVEKTPFGHDLVDMLAGKNAVAMAVIMQEVLGPPKCKQ